MQKKIVRSPYNLLVNILALALALGALATAPAPVEAAGLCDSGCICDTGCVDWSAAAGCMRYISCCSNAGGGWACFEHNLNPSTF